MRRLAPLSSLLLALSVGCGSSSATGPATPEGEGGSIDAVEAALTAEGLDFAVGAAVPFRVGDCARLASCFGNNATSPYVLFAIPPAPGDDGAGLASALDGLQGVPTGTSVVQRLRPDEAVVIVGRTPPKARYFGFTPYLFDRDDGTGARKTVFASLGDTLNPVTLRHFGASPFDASFAIVMAADATTEQRARAALEKAGYPAATVSTTVLPSSVVRLGTTRASDVTLLLGRVALFEDATRGAAWLDAPPLAVLRVTPKAAMGAAAARPIPAPARAARGSGTNEEALSASLDALGTAIAARHANHAATEVPIGDGQLVGGFLNPEACIANLSNCLGDNGDALYAAGPIAVALGSGKLLLSDDPDDFFVVYGVNHEASGKGTYSNFLVQNAARQEGVAAWDSTRMAGSADAYLPTDANRGKLFAVRVARRCAGAPHCLEVPTGEPGVPLEGNLLFVFRTYLEPGRPVSPDASEVLVERVWHFTKR